MAANAMNNWNSITSSVLRLPLHRDLKVQKSVVCHPTKDGFVKSIGDFQGQIADYRKRLSDGRSIHVREYSTFFSIHWDKVDPSDLMGHLIEDAPHWILIGIFGFIALVGIGLWLSESEK